MKLAALALASLVALATPRVADACEPYPRCDTFCDGPTSVVEAEVVAVDVSYYMAPVALHIVATYGDMTGLAAGSDITVANYSVFGNTDAGKTLVLLVDHDTDGTPRVSDKVDADGYTFAGECFGFDTTAADVAAIVFSPDCSPTLQPEDPPPPDCPTGIDCNAGSARGGLPLVLVLGFAVRRRRRR